MDNNEGTKRMRVTIDIEHIEVEDTIEIIAKIKHSLQDYEHVHVTYNVEDMPEVRYPPLFRR